MNTPNKLADHPIGKAAAEIGSGLVRGALVTAVFYAVVWTAETCVPTLADVFAGRML